MRRKWLFLPIEVKVRELHGKLLLAMEAAGRGFDVVLGPKNDLYAMGDRLPRGVMFNIGMGPDHTKWSAAFKSAGHCVVALDEEGIALYDDAFFVRHRVCKDASALTDLAFCWGRHHADLVASQINGANCAIHCTGNPRFDLLQPRLRGIFKREAEAIRRAHGSFILFNTNFQSSNHFGGRQAFLDSLKQRGLMEDPADRRFFGDLLEWKQELCEAFMSLVPRMAAAFPDRMVIIRPHPSENHAFWRERTAGLPNVKVIHEGNVVAWLLAAEVLVHNSCTTAIEAFALDKPAVAYRPVVQPRTECDLPNRVSRQAATADEAIAQVAAGMSDGLIRDEGSVGLLREHVANLDERRAAESIVEVLLQPGVAPAGVEAESPARWLRMSGALRRYADRIRNRRGLFNPYGDYAAQKCPPLDPEELRGLAATIGAATGEGSSVRITAFARQSCLIRAR